MGVSVLILADQFPPSWGTLSIRAETLALGLRKLGWEVTVVTFSSNSGGIEKYRSIDVIRLPSYVPKGGGLLRIFKYSMEMAETIAALPFWLNSPPDVVVSSIPQYMLSISGFFLSRLWKRPLIVEVRDLWPESIVLFKSSKKDAFLWTLLKRISYFAFSNADVVVASNPKIAREIVESYKIEEEKVHVILSPYRARKIPSNSLEKTEPVLIYAGNLGFSQGPDLIIEAAREIRKRVPDARVEVAGDGSLKRYFIERLKTDSPGNVTFLGSLNHFEALRRISSSYACLVMLRDFKGLETALPGKLIECMAMGKPVIGALRGVGREVILSSGAGVVVEPEDPVGVADAFEMLWRRPEMARDMGESGLQYVKKMHSPEKFINAYKEVIKSVVKGRG